MSEASGWITVAELSFRSAVVAERPDWELVLSVFRNNQRDVVLLLMIAELLQRLETELPIGVIIGCRNIRMKRELS